MQNWQINQALKVIVSNRKHSLLLEPFMYMPLLQFCIDKKAESAAHLIHAHIITNGQESYVHLGTKLIILYSKVVDVLSARNVFDRMYERNVVSWTAMISGYAQNGYDENALLLFSAMRRAGFRANQFTFGSVLRACTRMGWLRGGSMLHGCIEKGRFVENLFVKSALLDLYAKCGWIEGAWFLFERMEGKDLVSWNAMIGGLAIHGLIDDSFHLFRTMMREGMTPDCFTFGSVLRASVGGIGLMRFSQMHGLIIKLGLESSDILTGTLIDVYAKYGSIRSAYLLYKSMLKKDTISCTALITGFARECNHNEEAFDLFKEMIFKKMGIDDVILCLMLNICANMASLGLGRQVHALIFKYQPSYDAAMGNALIDMYAKSGEIADASHAFQEMGEKNVISWTSLIAGYAKHGYGQEAIALYEKMECVGIVPNDVTFLSLLFACSHTGLTGEGWELFNDMINKYKIIPRAEHFSCMVDMFARRGQLESAYNIILQMNIKPSASLWSAILGACSIYGNTSLGEIAATNLFNMEPEKSVNYVVLSNIYTVAGAWDNAWKIRELMEERSLRKNPGYSFLQPIKKKILLLEPR